MTAVFFLYHIEELSTDEDPRGKLIGVYSTQERARDAIHRLSDQPGFRDYPERWRVFERIVDCDDWPEGFVPETHKRISSADSGSRGCGRLCSPDRAIARRLARF